MRKIIICAICVLSAVGGCGRSEDRPTPEQAAQLDVLRQATIKQLETMLRRPLTEPEKQCVVVRLRGGKLDSHVAPPLSETIKRWHAQTKPS